MKIEEKTTVNVERSVRKILIQMKIDNDEKSINDVIKKLLGIK